MRFELSKELQEVLDAARKPFTVSKVMAAQIKAYAESK